jgi:hypothetical protein
VTTTSDGSQPPRDLTPFQSQCANEVARILRENNIPFRREQVEGEKESYLVFDVEPSSARHLKIYVYEDEAGFSLGKHWHLWEIPAYDDSQLLVSFLDGLRSAIQGD